MKRMEGLSWPLLAGTSKSVIATGTAGPRTGWTAHNTGDPNLGTVTALSELSLTGNPFGTTSQEVTGDQALYLVARGERSPIYTNQYPFLVACLTQIV